MKNRILKGGLPPFFLEKDLPESGYQDWLDSFWAKDIEELFTHPRSVDLYCDVVTKATEWPTHSHSIKALAKYLGFAWRDVDPSGAASIEWYHRWVEERDPAVRQRILDYNEDDCLATAVLLDKVRQLANAQSAAQVSSISALPL